MECCAAGSAEPESVSSTSGRSHGVGGEDGSGNVAVHVVFAPSMTTSITYEPFCVYEKSIVTPSWHPISVHARSPPPLLLLPLLLPDDDDDDGVGLTLPAHAHAASTKTTRKGLCFI